jgi:enoyl-[acyl-carrier protein] reductase III
MIDLSGRVALVTGGSRGIGRACALRLAQAGADVAINFLTSQSAARGVAEEVRQLGRLSATIKADVSEPQDVAAMIDYVGRQFGKLDIIVSNAAGGGFRSLTDVTPRQFEAAMRINTWALLGLAQQSLPLLAREDRQAKVIALSSHGSHRALPHYGLVGATKAALESLIRHLALELGPRGINFNAVLSGLVETDAVRNLPQIDELVHATRERTLLAGRTLTPGDVADVVAFLSSAESDLIQGQTIVVDGGVGLHG